MLEQFCQDCCSQLCYWPGNGVSTTGTGESKSAVYVFFTVFKFTLVLIYPPPSPSIASQEKKSIKCLCCLLSYMSLHNSLDSWLGLHACVQHSNLSKRVQCDLRANITSFRFKTSRHLSHLHCGYNAYVLDMSGTSIIKHEFWFPLKKYNS